MKNRQQLKAFSKEMSHNSVFEIPPLRDFHAHTRGKAELNERIQNHSLFSISVKHGKSDKA